MRYLAAALLVALIVHVFVMLVASWHSWALGNGHVGEMSVKLHSTASTAARVRGTELTAHSLTLLIQCCLNGVSL